METLIEKAEPMQSETIGKLALALSKAQGAFEGANKSADNPFFKSKYADLHECILAAREPLSQNELAVIQTTELSDNGLVVVTTLAHSSGEWIKGKISMKPKKDDDQGRGSSLTYARRYGYTAIVGLAQKDDDGNDSCKKPEQKPKQVKKPAPKQTPQTNKTSADWEITFESYFKNPRSRTVNGVKEWTEKNKSNLQRTLKGTEKTKFQGFLKDMELLYAEEAKENGSKLTVNV